MENWMSKIPDDKKIILINIPGSHDSCAFKMHYFGSIFAKTQNLDIQQQLKIGVRHFDIRVALNNAACCGQLEKDQEKDIDLICCHGICNCHYIENNKKRILTYKDVLNQIKSFLMQYPTEMVIIKTESGRGNIYNNLKRSTEIFSKIIGEDFSVKYNENLTLGDVRGKIVYTIFLTDKTTKKGVPIFNTRIKKSTSIIGIHRKHTNDDLKYNEYEVGGELKVKEVKDLFDTYNMTFEQAEKELEKENGVIFPLNYETSCTGEFDGIVPLPRHEASIVNKFLIHHDFKQGYYYGWISVDFVNEIFTNKIILSNFSK